MGEFTKALETLGGRESPPVDAIDRTLRRFEQRHRRRRVGSIAVGLGATALLMMLAISFLRNAVPPSPAATSPPAGHARHVYRDQAGWDVVVPPGWHVTPFHSSNHGVFAAGAEISNLTLVSPTVVSWAPIQADGRSFPKAAIALVVGTQEGGSVSPSPISDLPLTYPEGWNEGSALPGAATLDAIWFRGGGHVFVATVKTGPDATPADRRALERIVRSIRFEGATIQPPTERPTTSAPSRAALAARILLPSRTLPAGSSMKGIVVVRNNSGHVLRASGCGSPFAVALANDHVMPTVGWLGCLQRFTFPVGASRWPVTVEARYDECGPKPLVRCVRRHPPALPPGKYRARLFESSDIVPIPPPVPVRVTS
jgi:hypothetical protein